MSEVLKRKQLKSEIREKRRHVLPKLRKAVKDATSDRTKRIRACKADCKKLLRKAKQRATVARRKLEIVIKRAQAKAREACSSCKVLDEKGLDAIQKSLEALDKERKEIIALRSQAASLISERGRAGGRRAAEIRAESDEEVIRNLDEDKELIALFKSMRMKIKKTPRRSRTEAFLEFVHDHPEALDELRAKAQLKYEKEAERMFAEREPPPCTDELSECQRELAELKAAEKFLTEAEKNIPF